MDLPELRARIDSLDDRLIALLNERADLVHAVGELKRTQGLEIYAPEREEQLLRALVAKNEAQGGRLPPVSVRSIYREIMGAALALEKELVIAYMGPPATWTHQAARQKFGGSVEYTSQPSIADVFDAVARDRADYGVVPIENSTEGAVNHTLDVFMETDLRICAQISLRIENHLLARVTRGALRRLYSHPQVFGQCRNWLRTHFPTIELIEVSSTSRAGELAAQADDAGALGGRMVAEVHGLSVLESSVQDQANNATRFLVIGPRDCPPTGQDKTSLMFSVPDRAGALLSALEPFRDAGIDLTKIESRPSKRKPWEYVFFVDAEGHAARSPLAETLEELRRRSHFVKVLGSYPLVGEEAGERPAGRVP